MNGSRDLISIQDGVICLSGALTHGTVNAVYQNTPAFTEPDYRIDLREVEKVDSAAFALFLIWRDRAARNSSNLRFSHVPDKLKEIAQLANLERVLD